MVNKRRRKAVAQETRSQRQRGPGSLHVRRPVAFSLARPTLTAATANISDDTTSDDTSLLPGGLHRADVATTLRTIRVFASDANLFTAPPFRELRASLHPLVLAQIRKYEPIDYSMRVTHALRQQRWSDAAQALEGLVVFDIVVKQGTIQRWVRDCAEIQPEALRAKMLDAVLRSSRACGTCATSARSEILAATLAEDLVRVSAATLVGNSAALTAATCRQSAFEAVRIAAVSASATAEDHVLRFPAWMPGRAPPSFYMAMRCASAWLRADAVRQAKTAKLRIVHKEKGEDRQPPNHYDLNIWLASKRGLKLAPNDCISVKRHEIDGIHGAFMLTNVLDEVECENMLTLAKRMGFRKDHPMTRETPWPTLAVEWLLDASALDLIWNRVKPHLPPTFPGGHVLEGINCRWRLFSYSEGGVYRPHIDGSWPGSGLCVPTAYTGDGSGSDGHADDSLEGLANDGGVSASDGMSSFYHAEYVHDANGGACRSRLTFLVYLNDDFVGGETTFYLPADAGGGSSAVGSSAMAVVDSAAADGPSLARRSLEARPVRPRRGAVLCFPQANSASLLHEGSAVTRGVKFVARTDVLYRWSGGRQRTQR